MAAKAEELRKRATQLARHPRTRKLAIWFVSIVAAIGVFGALVAPPLLRNKLAADLSRKLHREVSIEQIRINPYALSATIRGFMIKERQGSATAVSFGEIYVNLELISLFHRGLVLKEIRLVKPYVSLVRNEDESYNFTDLIGELTKGPPRPSGPPPRFSLSNIEIIDGKIDFDDRPQGVRHAVSSIQIGVPFVSSIPYHADIKVEPAFSALVNGAPLAFGGQSKPFAESRESTLQLNITQLQIPKYIDYSPVALNFTVPSGELEGNLRLSFQASKEQPAVLAISGNVEIKNLAVREKDDTPILSLPSFRVVIDSLEVFARKAGLKSVTLQAPELHVMRNRDGKLNLSSLVAFDTTEKATEQKQESAPFAYRVDEVLLDEGKLYFTDRSLQRVFQKRLDNIRVSVKGLTNEAGKKAETEISFHTDANEQLNHSGALQLAPLLAEGTVELGKLQLGGLRPYYETVIGVEIKRGLLDFGSRFRFEQKGQEPDIKLSELSATLRSLRVDVPGESQPLWQIPLLTLKDGTVDVGKKTVVIGVLEGRGASAFIHREADGAISYARLVKRQPAETPTKPTEQESAWTVASRRIVLDRMGVVFEDRSLGTPSRIAVSDLSVRAENLSNAKNTRANVTLRARINKTGSIALGGTAATNPVAARFEVEARRVELLPFQPYLVDRVNFLLAGGELGTRGDFSLETASDGSSKMNYHGDLQVADFASSEKSGAQDLLRWKSLDVGGIRFSMQPVQLHVADVTLAGFYSRVIIASDGKINLQNLIHQKAEAEAESAALEPPGQTAAKSESSPPTITIGKINLKDGNVNFSDFFVKPNYTVNLTQLQGSISELRAETPGDLLLESTIDNAAPVEINGKINPLGNDLFLDVKANAREIEMSPLTPYSAKYVGYGIDQGKLSLDVQYKVENRKLSAQNKIVLNQLTFGERIESPTATKAPVLLAVALLKDRNGVIDVDLPIGGSLDDPEFSVGGIVLQLVLNIITRAVTAPFALLGSVFGGGEELSYVEFDYGRDRLTATAESRIKTLAVALANRPALRLEISGRFDPVNDREGLKRASLERKVKAQKLKELVRQGTAVKSVDEVKIEKGEYERYLRAAYREESFPRPRNFIGLVKDLPVAEMEELMLKHTQVTEDDLRGLANRRAQTVRDRLLDMGQIGADRLFLIAAKPLSADEKETTKVKNSRADFSLR